MSDHHLRVVLTPRTREWLLRIRLEKRRRVFWASVHMDGLVTITESVDVPTDAAPPLLSKRLAPFTPGQSVEISFENVDYRLALSVGGKEVLATSSAQYGPDLGRLRKAGNRMAAVPPQLQGQGGSFELSHLVIERDVYYFQNPRATALGEPWPRQGWASPDSPIYLRKNEYFMLGDNTAASKDSRLWDTCGPHLQARGEAFQLGTVPKDQLIGKAFLVYWPHGNTFDWVPLLRRVGLIDVGRMRWIR